MKIESGQKWDCNFGMSNDEIRIRTIRVMVVLEGYVMYRVKGCSPGVDSLSRFQERIKKMNGKLKPGK